VDAREAARQGGSPQSLAPVTLAIEWLEIVSAGRPGPAAIARLTLQAAAAAAQSEREEMRLYLDSALQMEMVQRAAGLPGLPVLSAVEVAGDLWLQVHRYDEAIAAYDAAEQLLGPKLRMMSGRARAARGANDVASACAGFAKLIAAWGQRSAEPLEIAEARTYRALLCGAR
jgi:hypothetical protein